MRCAGIDIGSRSIKLVVTEGGDIKEFRRADTGFDPLATAGSLLEGVAYDRILATGYGRTLFEVAFEAPTVTEIKAHGAGARAFFPEAKTVLDIGGQDSKVICLNDDGRVVKFEMNDRCAAGTGKFLEIMARALGFSVEQFGLEALKATKNIKINSMCTVFAESEVTGLVARGVDRLEIAGGLHDSVARRAAGMLSRVSSGGTVIFTGGVAKNPCIREFLERILDRPIQVPAEPQMVGAYGASLIAGG
jgi:(R)-2-hydroxyacyl-CoA dehydratese activating ATPase